MPRSSVQLLQPLLAAEAPVAIQDLVSSERKPHAIATAHLLLFVSQWLAAGNYVFFRAFYNSEKDSIGYYSAPIYSLIRGVLALGLIPLIYSISRPSLGQARQYPPWMRKSCWAQIFAVPTTEQKAALIEGISGAVRQNLLPFGLMFTEATSAGIVQPFVPIGSTMIALAVGLEKGNKIKYISVILGIAGVLVAGRVYAIHELDIGFLILLAVPLTKAAQLTEQRVAMSHMQRAALHIQQLFILAIFTAVLVYIIFGGDTSDLWSHVVKVKTVGWASIAYSVLFILLIEWWIQLKAVRVIGPVTVGLYQVLQPCCCFLLSHIILEERYHIHQLIGAALMCIALAIHCYCQFERYANEGFPSRGNRRAPRSRPQRATVTNDSSKRPQKIAIKKRAATGI